ncbi:MAG: 3-oxoacyl-ACP reductase [Hyperthermus sp.]|nr:MAG: 3-oxoacyl-ACP reductase [Hyperthermus sp.]
MEDCTVMVTGSSRGIGRATILRFARHGCSVIVTYHTRRGAAEATAEEAKRLGANRALVVRLDVASPASIREARAAVEEEFDKLNILVNNAGILHVGTIDQTSIEDWERTIRVNLTGAFLVTKEFLPLLRRAEWASIVNVASIAGQTGNIVASTAYAASKAGIIGFTKRLAIELAEEGIRVNAVAPSFTETDMVRDLIATRDQKEKIRKLHPLREIIKPEDVAEAIYFLAMPSLSGKITGQVIGVNAGRLTC